MEKSPVVLIPSMHRSGTSVLSNLLGAMGGQHGASVMPPSPHNPRGYGENVLIQEFHDKVLTRERSTWYDPGYRAFSAQFAELEAELLGIFDHDFEADQPIIIKDPRMCRLLPQWKNFLSRHFPDHRYLLIGRHPHEVALSLGKRDGFCSEWSILLWLQHVLLAERHTRDSPRLILLYEELLGAPPQTAERIAGFLGWTFDPEKAREIVENDLRHHHTLTKPWDCSQEVDDLAVMIWEKGFGQETPAAPEDWDGWWESFLSLTGALKLDRPERWPDPQPLEPRLPFLHLQCRFFLQRPDPELVDQLRESQEALARISQKSDALHESMARATQRLEQLAEKHERLTNKFRETRKRVERWNHQPWYHRALHKLRLDRP